MAIKHTWTICNGVCSFFFGKLDEKRPLVRPNFGARIILKWTVTNRV
jgi:hypothetical protein